MPNSIKTDMAYALVLSFWAWLSPFFTWKKITSNHFFLAIPGSPPSLFFLF